MKLRNVPTWHRATSLFTRRTPLQYSAHLSVSTLRKTHISSELAMDTAEIRMYKALYADEPHLVTGLSAWTIYIRNSIIVNTIQYSTVQYSTIQYNTIQYMGHTHYICY